MFVFYDDDSDTLQVHTRRYSRDRGRPMLVVPDWEPITPHARIPDWLDDAAEDVAFAFASRVIEHAPRLFASPLDLHARG